MLAALAFVPVDDIVESFEHLAASMPDETQPITDYFEDTYIGRLQRHGRRQPPFAHTMWSVHNRVEEGLPRTNNHVEGWHRRMQSNVGAYHPSIWHFLNVLRREQSLNESREGGYIISDLNRNDSIKGGRYGHWRHHRTTIAPPLVAQ